ncbi:Very-long-chain (3R)-3-hydroxyacyl-CoA dehydratase hpo-8 [Candida viswanathii]|uniref:Very-long-chain (3R)-3-hydroxyacyl-CoA dehydratase n=1 Tax=Candida viswanathii TaxID=5486 RepID=A0A367YN91_9ASCO|nr:Very-long-chain (3R)-3-hydroxyacyl-CoA dehydratase hpo-8 [Candida viswanathii]
MKSYLIFYNGVSALLWAYILVQCVKDYSAGSYPVEDIPHKFMVYTQIFNSSVEILHSVIGLVPTPIPTLLLQSFARLIIMIGICVVIPESLANYDIVVFSGLTLAWSITEVIRYGFYVIKLSGVKTPPYWLVWLRYSAFFVLYPLGLVCESLTVYNSYDYVKDRLPYYYYFLKYAIVLYIPGFLYLYTYMIGQRSKVLRKSKQA